MEVITKTFSYLLQKCKSWFEVLLRTENRIPVVITLLLSGTLTWSVVFVVVHHPAVNFGAILSYLIVIGVSLRCMGIFLKRSFKDTFIACGIVVTFVLILLTLIEGKELLIPESIILIYLPLWMVGGKWFYHKRKNYLVPFLLLVATLLIWLCYIAF